MNINLNPNSELNQSIVNVPDVVQVPDVWINEARQFRMAMMMYACAIREVKTKLEVLNDELSIKNQRNPIEMIKSRVKKPMSILEKLQRRGLPVSVESMVKNLDDVAGIRIICSFVDDIYEVAEMLVRQDDVTVIAIKDYIKNPKPSGYRSLHLIVRVPIFLQNEKCLMKVEVQLRTIAMDFWASLEHKLRYKKEIPEFEKDSLQKELFECAQMINTLDQRMEAVKNRLAAGGQWEKL